MKADEYQRIVDERLENWQLTEEEFVESWLYFLRADFYSYSPRYVPPILRMLGRSLGKSKDAMWADLEAARRPELLAAYRELMQEHSETIGQARLLEVA